MVGAGSLNAYGAGKIRERVAFDARQEIDDGHGNTVAGDFVEQFIEPARIFSKLGGERIVADRLASIAPVVIRVRYWRMTALIQPGWQARNVRTSVVYNITHVANMDEKKQWLDITAVAGEAT